MHKQRTSRDRLLHSLREQKDSLHRFRECVNQLMHGIEFRSQSGHRLFYSVDFSEIYSYLHYGDPGVKNFGVNIVAPANEDEAKAKAEEQHYLALTHLFKSLTDEPLYLLQPYVLEMYSYARSQAHRGRGLSKTLKNLITTVAENLNVEQRALLRGAKDLTESQKREMLQTMLADYPRLSIDLLEFDRWRRQNQELSTRGQLLNSLLQSRRLTHRTDEILRDLGFRDSELERPTLEEETKVADMFPKGQDEEEEERQFSRLVDARALLLLRNMNRLLRSRGARLVLVTRDMKSPKIAGELAHEEWFGWPGASCYFYGIETVFIDLLLQPLDDADKLGWLTKADAELTAMIESVEQVLTELSSDGAPFMSTDVLSEGAHTLLGRNSAHWNQLIEVEFIRTSPAVEWLGHDFVTRRVLAQRGDAQEPPPSGVEQQQIFLLEQLVTLIDSDEFQRVASKGADKLWVDIAADAFGMNKLGFFSDKLNDVLIQMRTLLAKKFDEPELFRSVINKSKSFLHMPAVQFEPGEYDEFVKNFKPWAYKSDSSADQFGQQLARLYTRAANDTTRPENCLFMAFVLGMLDHWDAAVEIAQHGLAQSARRGSPELEYFLANAISRQVDMRSYDPADALELYASAVGHIRRALDHNPYEPRYLERLATISLKFHDLLRQLSRRDGAAPDYGPSGVRVVSEREAIGLLREVVKRAHDDRRLRVRALNNLAYIYGVGDNPQLDAAQDCLSQIEREFDEATDSASDSLPEMEKWPFVMDTVWFIGAKIAFERGNADDLGRKLDLLRTAYQKANLTDWERAIIEGHIEQAQGWQRALGLAGADQN